MTVHLEVADAIGRHLAATAIRDGDRCTWVGPIPVAARGLPGVAFAALEPDLYGGTAGVGLVLAEIAAATDDRDVRRAAAGAIRQALACADDLPPDRALGLFSGRLGIAWAAARAGALVEDAAIVEAAGALTLAVRGADAGDRHDLTGGRAGAIIALLDLADGLDLPELRCRAAALGDELLDAARPAPAGFWWPHPTMRSRAGLIGLSHGAAGIAHALLELGAVSAEARFRAAAGAAMAYERAAFDPASGNWPDHREPDGPARDGFAPAGLVYWCHGGPGIALARRRAWRLTGDEASREEAAAGVRLTERWVRAAVATGTGGWCACHGLAGNAEVLLDCADAVGEGAEELRRLALAAAAAGIEEHSASGRPWPCGTHGGESPGLMLGLAGIARFYLRLHDPGLPSLLLPVGSRAGQGAGGTALAASTRP